jgi:tungstate transport system substrate-binding protein
MKKVLIIFALILISNLNSFSKDILRLATTTSTYETGLLDHILPQFNEQFDVEVHVISVGTGKAIRLGKNGDVDIILIHAPEAAGKFVSQGYGYNKQEVMYNDFLILGPPDDPAKIRDLSQAAQALKVIHYKKALFVSRDDDSGTHKKELFLWEKAALRPEGSWYMESGQGMSATLRIADEKKAYILIDRGTYLYNKDAIRLAIVLEADPDLLNLYEIIAVNPGKHPQVKHELAQKLINWLTSRGCQNLIDNYKVKGQKLFQPSKLKRN